MAPEVLLRKLSYLRRLLADLAPYENASLNQVVALFETQLEDENSE